MEEKKYSTTQIDQKICERSVTESEIVTSIPFKLENQKRGQIVNKFLNEMTAKLENH